MTHPAAPAPSSSPEATAAASPEPRTEGTSPPRTSWWRRPAPVLGLLFAIVSLVFSVMQLVGSVGDLSESLGGLLGPGAVSSSQVSSEIQSRLTSGLATCSEDLPAEVGASIDCTVLDGSDTATVRATVTAVDGDDVNYRIATVD